VARALQNNGRTSCKRTVNQPGGQQQMKRLLMSAALCLTLGVGLAAPALAASQNKNGMKAPKTMSARQEALKKCTDDYNAAVKKAKDDFAAASKDAKTKKGKDKSDAMTAATKAKNDGMATAKKNKADCTKAAPAK
jgi:hypothetical protein